MTDASPPLAAKALSAEFFFVAVVVAAVAVPVGPLAIAVVPTPFVIGVAVPSPVGLAVFPWVSYKSISTV